MSSGRKVVVSLPCSCGDPDSGGGGGRSLGTKVLLGGVFNSPSGS